MEELKPKLVLAKSGRSRFDFGKYIFILIIFGAGFYFGYSYKSLDFELISDSKEHVAKLTSNKINSDKLNPVNRNKVDNPPKALNQSKPEIDHTAEAASKLNKPQKSTLIEKDILNQEVSQPVSDKHAIAEDKDDEAKVLQGSVAKINSLVSSDPSVSADDVENKYTLQIAAFETERKTNEVVSELANKGYKVYSISVVNSQGDTWNLVRLGNFSTFEEAKEFSEMLLNTEGINSNIKTIEKPKVSSAREYY